VGANPLGIVQSIAAPDGPSTAVTVVLAVLGSGVVAAILGTVLGNTRANRDRYAQVVRCLVAWAEFPYRVRRRTDDEPATLTALADRGHTLQEQLAESRAWVAAESRAVSEVFDSCIRDLSTSVGPACVAAWQAPPISNSAGMNLGDFGPRGVEKILIRMETAVTYRFGLRRLMWRRWVLHRLRQRGRIPAPRGTTDGRDSPGVPPDTVRTPELSRPDQA
jgi:hypothetical protein